MGEMTCRYRVSVPLLRFGVWAFVLWTLVFAQPPAQLEDTQVCSPKAQRDNLLSFYARTAGWGWKRNDGWTDAVVRGTAAPVFSAAVNCVSPVAGVVLPDHCCFYGVECCDREQCPPMASFLDTSCDCKLGTVTALRLDYNNLTGSFFGDENASASVLADTMLSGAACSLKYIDVQHNQLTGTIPSAITLLTQLRVFNVAYNSMSGALPDGLKSLKQIRLLHLAMNNFSGDFPQDLCDANGTDSLSELILASNPLHGSIDIYSCENLILLNMIDCNISTFGLRTSPKALPMLHMVFMSRNNLQGSHFLDNLTDVAPFLTALDLTDNSLTGSLPASFSNLKLLASLVLSGNHFTGTMPSNLFAQLDSLSYLDLSHNGLQGEVPESLGAGKQLRYVDLSYNRLNGTLPPEIVDNVPSAAYVDLTSNAMSCCGRGFTVLSEEPFNWQYERYDLTAERLPSRLLFSDVCWTVDSSGLCCPLLRLNNTADLNATNGNSTGPVKLDWFLDPEYYMFENCRCPLGLTFRKELNENNRYVATCGEPPRAPWPQRYFWIWIIIGLLACCIFVALHWWLVASSGSRPVLLQSVLDMRKRLKGAPLSGMVSVVVTDIEGYTGMMTQHPDLMMQALQMHNALIRQAKWKNYGTTVEQEGDSYTLVFHEPMDACKFCLQAQQLLEKQEWPEGLLKDSQPRAGPKKARLPAFLSHGHMQRLMTSLHASLRFRSQKQKQQGGDGKPASSPSSTMRPPSAGDSKTATSARVSEAGQHNPIRGLRVRMGVFTGFVPEGSGIAGSQVVEMAKVVSDAAAGGQVLLCGATFQSVGPMGKELGCVDENGLNFSKLGSWWRSWTLHKKQRHHQVQEQDATLLDMGSYLYCPQGTELPMILSPHLLDESSGLFRPQRQRMSSQGQQQQQQQQQQQLLRALHLYQLLAPSMVARGCYFGSRLSLKPEWRQLDRDFYQAPGALVPVHEHAPGMSPEFTAALPKVTMVFTAVEGAKPFALRHRSRDVREIHAELLAVVRSCLLQVPGGYLLRTADLELKFMTAFRTPEAALTWCMAVQECALYANWPQPALKYWPEEHGPEGQLLFRGPRLKMGVCEGFPRSLLPDFAGKADYLGDNVNQAARFMDAAAHGGQVACEQSLIDGLVSLWRRGATVELRLDRETLASCVGAMPHAQPYPHPGNGTSLADLGHNTLRNGSERQSAAGTAVPHPHMLHEVGACSARRESAHGASHGPPSDTVLPTLREDDDAGEGLEQGAGLNAEPHRSEQLQPYPANDGVATANCVATTNGAARCAISAKPATLLVFDAHSLSQRLAAEPPSMIDTVAQHIGSFAFKGVPGSTSMVSLSHQVLAARRFPADSPGGKGSRTARKDGVLAYMTFPMLPVISEYRMLFERVSRVNTPLSLSQPPTIPRQGSGRMLSRVVTTAKSFISPSASRSRLHMNGLGAAGGVQGLRDSMDLPRSTADLPRSTPDLPRSTTDLPRSTTDLPCSTPDPPRSTAELPLELAAEAPELSLEVNAQPPSQSD